MTKVTADEAYCLIKYHIKQANQQINESYVVEAVVESSESIGKWAEVYAIENAAEEKRENKEAFEQQKYVK